MINHARSVLLGLSSQDIHGQSTNNTCSVDTNQPFVPGGLAHTLYKANSDTAISLDYTNEPTNLQGTTLYIKNALHASTDSLNYFSLNNGILIFNTITNPKEIPYSDLHESITLTCGDLNRLQHILLSTTDDIYFSSYRISQLIRILNTTPLKKILTYYDTRISYDENELFTPYINESAIFDSNKISAVSLNNNLVPDRFDFQFAILNDISTSTVTVFDKHITAYFSINTSSLSFPLPYNLGYVTLRQNVDTADIIIVNRPTLDVKTVVKEADSLVTRLLSVVDDNELFIEIRDYYQHNLSDIKKLAAITALLIYLKNKLWTQNLSMTSEMH